LSELADAFSTSAAPGERAERTAYFGPEVGERAVPVVRRPHLRDSEIIGPAIVEEFDTTVVVPPGWRATLDRLANVVLTAIGTSEPERKA
jgi:N-methylhydantoinase A